MELAAGLSRNANPIRFTAAHAEQARGLAASDQLFGLVCDLILKLPSFEEPSELLSSLVSSLAPRFASRFEKLTGIMLPAVRDFQQFLFPLGRTLNNAFANRGGVEAPHSFSFKLGRQLSEQEQRWFANSAMESGVMESGSVCEADSTYACVKTYMRDLSLQDAPTLIIPRERSLPILVPASILPPSPLSKEQATHYAKLAVKCLGYDMPAAAKALHGLLHQASGQLLDLDWLCEPGLVYRAPANDADASPFFSHLPKRSFQLFSADRPAAKRFRRAERTAK